MLDSGQLWISVNGGAYADVGKDAFSANGYTNVAIAGNGIAKGENGFGGTSAGYADGSYITTTTSLGHLPPGMSFRSGSWPCTVIVPRELNRTGLLIRLLFLVARVEL